VTPAALTPADRERLVKLLGLLGSSFAGERDAAGLAATRFLRERGLEWADVVLPNLAAPRGFRTEVEAEIETCIRALDRLTQWERQFVVSLRGFRHLSPKQAETVRGIARKARAAEYAA
jgi:hypothetical protein